MEDSVQVAAEASAASAAPTVASVGAQEDLFAGIQKLIPSQGGASGVTVMLAALAIVGGIALKFGPAFMKSRTELKLKQMELEEKKLESAQEANAEVKSEIASLDVRVSAVESKVKKLGGAAPKKPARR
jgi:hypothetical protein